MMCQYPASRDYLSYKLQTSIYCEPTITVGVLYTEIGVVRVNIYIYIYYESVLT